MNIEKYENGELVSNYNVFNCTFPELAKVLIASYRDPNNRKTVAHVFGNKNNGSIFFDDEKRTKYYIN